MRTPYIYIAMFLASLSLAISGANAVSLGVIAGESGLSTVSATSGISAGTNAHVDESTVLSFDGGAGISNQLTTYGDLTDICQWYNSTAVTTGLTSGVFVNVSKADSATIKKITYDPAKPNSKATKVSVTLEGLDATNAKKICVIAHGNNSEGDYAEQSVNITSPTRNATLAGYSGKATADKTSATATQSFKYASTDGAIDVDGSSWVMSGDYTTYIALTNINFTGSGVNKPLAMIGTSPTSKTASFTGTSTTKSKNSVSAVASASSLTGMNFTFNGDSSNQEGDGTAVYDIIDGNVSAEGTVNRAAIGTYTISMNAISSYASERRSYGSVSAGEVNISEFAMNYENDSATHTLDASSYYKSGTYNPAVVDGYCALTTDGLKATKTGITGGISVIDASGKYLALFAQTSHAYDEDSSDHSMAQISGSMASLDKPKSGQAYKMALAAAPKATSLTYSTIRGEGTNYAVYSEAYSDALDDLNFQSVLSGKPIGKIYTITTGTKSNGKAGITSGASAAVNIKFTSTY